MGKRKQKHGMSKTDEYGIWKDMIKRCTKPNIAAYERYGRNGVSVYQPWIESFKDFYEYIGPRPSKGHSVDRIDGKGNYEPGNVRWATRHEQNRNLGIPNTNTTRHKGVAPFHNKWRAYIGANKKIHLGTFDNIEDAIKARKEAEIKYWGKSS